MSTSDGKPPALDPEKTRSGPPRPPESLFEAIREAGYTLGEQISNGRQAYVVYAGTGIYGEDPCIITVAPEHLPKEYALRFELGEESLPWLVSPRIPRLIESFYCEYVPGTGWGFVVCKALDGELLGTRLRRQAHLPWKGALRYGEAVADILAELHLAHTIHGDLTPDGIFLCRSGDVRVFQSGLALPAGWPLLTDHEPLRRVPYLSPEQIATPTDVDRRTDIFSLGLILAHAVGGPQVLPEPRDWHPMEIVAALKRRRRLGQVATKVPGRIAEVIERACELDRDRRYATMAEFRAALKKARLQKA